MLCNVHTYWTFLTRFGAIHLPLWVASHYCCAILPFSVDLPLCRSYLIFEVWCRSAFFYFFFIIGVFDISVSLKSFTTPLTKGNHTIVVPFSLWPFYGCRFQHTFWEWICWCLTQNTWHPWRVIFFLYLMIIIFRTGLVQSIYAVTLSLCQFAIFTLLVIDADMLFKTFFSIYIGAEISFQS